MSLSKEILNLKPGELHSRGRIVGTVESWTDFHTMTAAFPSHPDQCAPLAFSKHASDLVKDPDVLPLFIQKAMFFKQLYDLLKKNVAYRGDFDTEDILSDLLRQDSFTEPDRLLFDWLDILQYPITTYDLTFGEALADTWKPTNAVPEAEWSEDTTNCAVIMASLLANRIGHRGTNLEGGPDILDLINQFSWNLVDKSLILVRSQDNGTISIGIRIRTTAPGDVVVLLEGAEWPIVLRQTGSTWSFVGVGFILGMMGEEDLIGEEDCSNEHNEP
ncbi:hypothetical protein EK21DRAFT_107725 [Setomelanomma holmii]|uniref:Uncharacterized protein n=1 Tax=Setomelanomma holmii TaxID=210430 RepID=A0A9P4LSB2_9PLEO|nr:hypothetical protein EK21DRAFT_107725 [Setomelanomma holmii]